MNDDVVIRIEGLWKRYGLPLSAGVRKGMGWLRKGRNPQPALSHAEGSVIHDLQSDGGPWALRDINLEVRRGETLGIIGRNGAGKSTLLKVLAGVTPPTQGRVDVRGSVFPMIELNAGLHPELTGRENIYLLGAVMGLTRREMATKLPEIEDFCELGEWFDRPVRTYSSGMLTRLGFAVAVNINSDIILVDETFAVGDLKFMNKSLAALAKMWQRGSTLLIVTHSLDQLQFISARAILLERGRVIASGDSREVLLTYEQSIFHREYQGMIEHQARSRQTTDEVFIESARVLNQSGETVSQLSEGQPFSIEAILYLLRPLEHPLFNFVIHNAAGVACLWKFSEEDGLEIESLEGRVRLRLHLTTNPLAPGAYSVNFAVRNARTYETRERMAGLTAFTVAGRSRGRAVAIAAGRWEVNSIASTAEPEGA